MNMVDTVAQAGGKTEAYGTHSPGFGKMPAGFKTTGNGHTAYGPTAYASARAWAEHFGYEIVEETVVLLSPTASTEQKG